MPYDVGLKLEYSGQYQSPCVWVDNNRMHLISAEELINFAKENGAYIEEEPGEMACVIYFSDRWPELYTESALKRCRNLGAGIKQCN